MKMGIPLSLEACAVALALAVLVPVPVPVGAVALALPPAVGAPLTPAGPHHGDPPLAVMACLVARGACLRVALQVALRQNPSFKLLGMVSADRVPSSDQRSCCTANGVDSRRWPCSLIPC